MLGIDQHEAHAGDVILDPVTAVAHRDKSPQQITSVTFGAKLTLTEPVKSLPGGGDAGLVTQARDLRR